MTRSALDDARLAAECREILGTGPDAFERLTHSVRATTTRGVGRVRAGGRTAVVKVITPRTSDPADASHRPSSFRYWRREAELLTSDVLGPYRAAGLRPPALLGRFERGPGEISLWMEEVDGRPGADWSLADFASLARRLGVAQGSLAALVPPTEPWLSRGFLREYLADVASRVPFEVLADEAAWRHDLVAEQFPIALRKPLARLHAEQDRFLAWVEAAPPTLAHLDLWPRNTLALDDEIVLIDWGFAGIGALGEDIGNLVLDSVWDLLHPSSILPSLDETVSGAYLAGLREAGWLGDERVIRLAMCASMVKYDWIAPVMLAEASKPTLAVYGGEPVEDRERLYAERGIALAFLAERADEARRLAAELGLGD